MCSSDLELLVPNYANAYCGELEEKTSKKIARSLGTDSLIYMTHDGLVRSIGIEKNRLCMACLDCRYPTKKGEEFYEIALKNFMEGKPESERVIQAGRRCQ